MSEAVYNKIGKSYDITRKPDAQIIKTLLRLLQPQNQGRYLDLGCGSGNYTDALNKHGLAIEGVDVSEEMISKARGLFHKIMCPPPSIKSSFTQTSQKTFG